MLAGEKVEMPVSYREVFERLSQIGLLKGQLAQELSDLVRIRNLLAHRYLDIRWQVIQEFLSGGRKSVEKFVSLVEHKVEPKPVNNRKKSTS